jgi:hypothetical protein
MLSADPQILIQREQADGHNTVRIRRTAKAPSMRDIEHNPRRGAGLRSAQAY